MVSSSEPPAAVNRNLTDRALWAGLLRRLLDVEPAGLREVHEHPPGAAQLEDQELAPPPDAGDGAADERLGRGCERLQPREAERLVPLQDGPDELLRQPLGQGLHLGHLGHPQTLPGPDRAIRPHCARAPQVTGLACRSSLRVRIGRAIEGRNDGVQERRDKRSEKREGRRRDFDHSSGATDLEGLLGEHTLDDAAEPIAPKGYRARSIAKTQNPR